MMPAGYVDYAEEVNWVDLHFGAYGRLTLNEVFALPTMAMAILEQEHYENDSIALQPATEGLLLASNGLPEDCPRIYVSSKPVALSRMLHDKLRYCLTTLPTWPNSEWLAREITVKETFRPTMVWCVYNVR